jgi:hypothetical protein
MDHIIQKLFKFNRLLKIASTKFVFFLFVGYTIKKSGKNKKKNLLDSPEIFGCNLTNKTGQGSNFFTPCGGY